MIAAPLLRIFLILLTPLNYLFSAWKYCLSKYFSFSKSETITPDEILMVIDEAKHSESIEFSTLCAGDILTPRVQLRAVEVGTSKECIKKIFSETGYSRILVFKNNIDHIIGPLHEKDFYLYEEHQGDDLSTLLKPVVYKTTNIKILKLLRIFQQTQTHMAIISDEYGGT